MMVPEMVKADSRQKHAFFGPKADNSRGFGLVEPLWGQSRLTPDWDLPVSSLVRRLSGHPAIDRENLTGDVSGRRTGQK